MPTRIGHVHLKVREIERSVAFYRAILGFDVTERVEGFAFLSGGAAHHELALQEMGPLAPLPSRGGVGLYHSAWEVDSPEELEAAAERLQAAGVRYQGVDHGISWALYFSDPDGNGVEIYLDRRGSPSGSVLWNGDTRRLDRRQEETSNRSMDRSVAASEERSHERVD